MFNIDRIYSRIAIKKKEKCKLKSNIEQIEMGQINVQELIDLSKDTNNVVSNDSNMNSIDETASSSGYVSQMSTPVQSNTKAFISNYKPNCSDIYEI